MIRSFLKRFMKTKTQTNQPQSFATLNIGIEELKPHPRNYRKHPQEQIDHLVQSITEHGFYRNIVVAADGTILAGHGVVEAAKQMGLSIVPVIRLSIPADSPKALKILAGDNEIAKLGDIDDRALTDMLKEIKETDISGLLGTGFTDQALAALTLATRPEEEIPSLAEAEEWAGVRSLENERKTYELRLVFSSSQEMQEFCQQSNIDLEQAKTSKNGEVATVRVSHA